MLRTLLIPTLAGLLAAAALAPAASASGTLTLLGSPEQPIQIRDHHVAVTIHNGFARTEVTQVFFNPNARDLEALYSFPVPKSAALSELSITDGETELHGEVVDEEVADLIYQSEREQGRQAGLATQDGYQDFEFSLARVAAGAELTCRFVYYQRLEIDTGVGRYVYPLEDGGTDEEALRFWTTNTRVERAFSMDITVKSVWPVLDVRLPGLEGAAVVTQQGPGTWNARIDQPGASLSGDVVFYYRLADDLPGRMEVLPYRAPGAAAGTFMLVATPGIDLGPITEGKDFLFVLDVSGSMKSKIHTLGEAVIRALEGLQADDRYRIVIFNNSARELTREWQTAEPQNVARAVAAVSALVADGGTDLFAGLSTALADLDADRTTCVLLVTDAVANQGIVEPARFAELVRRHDIRVFGFLLGNNANWPLMRTVCDASGGFYASVSNADDLLGQLMVAKSRIRHECLHDADLSIQGGGVFDATREHGTRVYRGQQLVVLGRYKDAGPATATLRATISGTEHVYTAQLEFPAVDEADPELERLWAQARIDELVLQRDLGLLPEGEAADAILGYGVDYQLVTDETSMLVVSDERFAAEGIDRRNRERTAVEHQAQAARSTQGPVNRRVDEAQPAFPDRAPRFGGGGAIDPMTLAGAALLLLLTLTLRRW